MLIVKYDKFGDMCYCGNLCVSSNYKMTLEQFQQKVLKANWYDKYYYYLLFLAAVLGGFFSLYDVTAHGVNYEKLGSRYLGYLAFLFLTSLGISGFYFVPNRCKAITIPSTLSIDKKRDTIGKAVLMTKKNQIISWHD